jgi:hypothetical protein
MGRPGAALPSRAPCQAHAHPRVPSAPPLLAPGAQALLEVLKERHLFGAALSRRDWPRAAAELRVSPAYLARVSVSARP